MNAIIGNVVECDTEEKGGYPQVLRTRAQTFRADVGQDAGSTGSVPLPAYIRSVGVPLDEADRAYIRRKLGRKLGKFEDAIQRVSVRVEDVNGPRSGHDKRCRIKIVLRGLPSVVVERQHAALQAALDGALERAGQTVKRQVQRRRMNVRKRRS